MTVQELITAALRSLKVIGSGETPSVEELNDAFLALNQLIASWSAQALPIPQIVRETFALTGASSYSIGAGQTLNTVRPLRIRAAAVLSAGMVIPLEVVTAEIYAAGLLNRVLFYDTGYPNGTVYIRPAPGNGAQLELHSYKPLAPLASLLSVLDLPPGYERALKFNLSGDLLSEYEVPAHIAQYIIKNADDAKLSIQGLNAANLGPPVPQSPGITRVATAPSSAAP